MQELGKGGKPATWDTELARQLYRNGLSDREIADAVGTLRVNVSNWRYRNGMKPNVGNRSGPHRVDYNELRRLYDMGLTDTEIRQRMKVSYGTIYNWLTKNNLPPCGIQMQKKHAPIGIPGETPRRPKGQKFFMSDSEILASMSRCENRREQVQILADLNACSRREMLKHLGTIGEDVSDLQPRRKGKINHSKAMELWEGGASDAGIAHCMGVSISGVKQWRERCGLQANCKEVQGQ